MLFAFYHYKNVCKLVIIPIWFCWFHFWFWFQSITVLKHYICHLFIRNQTWMSLIIRMGFFMVFFFAEKPFLGLGGLSRPAPGQVLIPLMPRAFPGPPRGFRAPAPAHKCCRIRGSVAQPCYNTGHPFSDPMQTDFPPPPPSLLKYCQAHLTFWRQEHRDGK